MRTIIITHHESIMNLKSYLEPEHRCWGSDILLAEVLGKVATFCNVHIQGLEPWSAVYSCPEVSVDRPVWTWAQCELYPIFRLDLWVAWTSIHPREGRHTLTLGKLRLGEVHDWVAWSGCLAVYRTVWQWPFGSSELQRPLIQRCAKSISKFL